MQANQYFGLGRDMGRIDLWCQVEEIIGDDIRFYVINGAWHGLYKADKTVVVYAPNEAFETVAEAIFVDPIPKFRHQYYNEAIAWMNNELSDEEAQLYLAKDNPAKWAEWIDDFDDDIPF